MDLIVPSWIVTVLLGLYIATLFFLLYAIIKNNNNYSSMLIIILSVVLWCLPIIGPIIVTFMVAKKRKTQLS